MRIDNPTGDPDCKKPNYAVRFEEREVADLRFDYLAPDSNGCVPCPSSTLDSTEHRWSLGEGPGDAVVGHGARVAAPHAHLPVSPLGELRSGTAPRFGGRSDRRARTPPGVSRQHLPQRREGVQLRPSRSPSRRPAAFATRATSSCSASSTRGRGRRLGAVAGVSAARRRDPHPTSKVMHPRPAFRSLVHVVQRAFPSRAPLRPARQ